MTALQALVVATALHAGFQLTVTVLVYPQLARVGPAEWTEVHTRHGRLITPLVAPLYAALLASGAWVLAAGPGGLAVAALGCAAACLGVTAVGAAPLHGRLDRPDPLLLRRLLALDRLRALLAVAAAALAGAALVG